MKALQWTSDSITALGIWIGHGDLSHANWDSRIDKFLAVVRSWRQRHLSLSGKALVLNALTLSGLWYTASLVAMPTWAFQVVHKEIFSFFWAGKKHLVSQNTLMRPVSQGGLNLVDLSFKLKALQVQWIRRFLS
jgi:hypothetical protein